jgi:Fe2+ transport system protein FeoA
MFLAKQGEAEGRWKAIVAGPRCRHKLKAMGFVPEVGPPCIVREAGKKPYSRLVVD